MAMRASHLLCRQQPLLPLPGYQSFCLEPRRTLAPPLPLTLCLQPATKKTFEALEMGQREMASKKTRNWVGGARGAWGVTRLLRCWCPSYLLNPHQALERNTNSSLRTVCESTLESCRIQISRWNRSGSLPPKQSHIRALKTRQERCVTTV